ncbi:phenylacetaldoxime dehydratase family protein, partial [Mesorhizobium metallidurans]|uniref:phenylacetaldoxime dehydratase family protein n=1 Tax=Mesorhizobium metallidurans TaxID=489722 RepID=UPI001427BA95
MFDEEIGPIQVERAKYVDAEGYLNEFWIAYWFDQSLFDAWQKRSAVCRWFAEDSRVDETSGYWMETFSMSLGDFETIFGTSNPAGVSCAAARMTENDRTHGYWGSMRDRIPNSASDPFTSPLGNKLRRVEDRDTFGKRWRITPPSNLCYIRSGQDYSHCGPEQRQTYLDQIAPVLKEGMDFLRDNGEETSCCSLRFAEVVGPGDTGTEQTFGLGYFLSIGNLEDWWD